MTALLLLGPLGLCGLAFWGCWQLCLAGIAGGDCPGDATTSVRAGGDGTATVVVANGPVAPVVVGISVLRPHRLRHAALVAPLVVRTPRRSLARARAGEAAPIVGVVEASSDARWRVEAGPRDRVVVTVGQPGGRLQVRDHAVAVGPSLTDGARSH